MKASRQILILHPAEAEPVAVKQLAEAIAHAGATALVSSMHDGQYDRILDAVELADAVLYWPPDRIS
jgi:hypothetical protein